MTYNQLIYDTLEAVRNNYISDDVDISEDHIMFLWDSQRALWLDREMNKNTFTNYVPQLDQSLGCLELIEVDSGECCDITTDCTILRTKQKLPNFLITNQTPAITRVGLIDKLKQPFSFIPYSKAPYISFGKYSRGVYAFYLDNYVYVISSCDSSVDYLEYINIRGVLENPADIKNFSCDKNPCFSYDDNYPMPLKLIPYIREQVVNSLLAVARIPKDKTNNAKEDLSEES